jgi:rhodanese-related sulfurtransferase
MIPEPSLPTGAIPAPLPAAGCPRSVDALLRDARRRVRRLPPHLAALAVVGGALLVDIRPVAQRRHEGAIPGSLLIERNVLEWRLDPASPDRCPQVTVHDQAIVVFCSEGYASSLAASSLVDLGLRGATDLIGGFQAWPHAGLAVMAAVG